MDLFGLDPSEAGGEGEHGSHPRCLGLHAKVGRKHRIGQARDPAVAVHDELVVVAGEREHRGSLVGTRVVHLVQGGGKGLIRHFPHLVQQPLAFQSLADLSDIKGCVRSGNQHVVPPYRHASILDDVGDLDGERVGGKRFPLSGGHHERKKSFV